MMDRPIAPLRQLSHLSMADFMRSYWQRRPLLLRAAFKDFQPPVSRARLFELAADELAESRLITREGKKWNLSFGPFTRRALPPLTHKQWTLLVQGVDTLDDKAHQLLAKFRFIADARLDDLMVSYATDGGGVGPHVDSYDVFLLQAAGRRRWRISLQDDHVFQTNAPLRILKNFRASEEWLLEPGDMLYLPPGVAHEGTAVGESLTYSIGFRAPAYQELLEPWHRLLAESTQLAGRYGDAGMKAQSKPAQLPAAMVDAVFAQLSRRRPNRTDTISALLSSLSEPKAQLVFERPKAALTLAAFQREGLKTGLVLDRRTRLLYSGRTLGINGEIIALAQEFAKPLSQLANSRLMTVQAARSLPLAGWDVLHDWYLAGWLNMAVSDGRDR